MVTKRFIILIVSSLVLVSCFEKEKNQEQVRDDCFSWSLNNDELQEQILEYFQTVDTGEVYQNNVLFLGVSEKDSSRISYNIKYITGASFFVSGYTHMIINIEEHPVCVYFYCEDNFFPTFKLSNESIIKLMKEYFPEDYRCFKNKTKDLGEVPDLTRDSFQLNTVFPPPSMWVPETWVLTFEDGKMIDKRIEP